MDKPTTEVAPRKLEDDNEESRPPLPPRSYLSSTQTQRPTSSSGSLLAARVPSGANLKPKPTTAVSLTDIHTQGHIDGSRENFAATAGSAARLGPELGLSRAYTGRSGNTSERDDTTSIMSFAPTIQHGGDVESLLGEVLDSTSPGWKLLTSQRFDEVNPFDQLLREDKDLETSFDLEFSELEGINGDGSNEESIMLKWKSRLKHYFILSSAGKPIYSRHGDENLISGYIGVVQTIISFYQDVGDDLKGFSAGDVRFVVMAEGPLYLVAISRLGESDTQLRSQLEALYMQILSTLTLPTLTHLFSTRANTDLRRLLQGTEPLLSALADSFTRGSPSTLLSALECLKIRKSQRYVINNTLLKARSPGLLYGLIVAGGRLVSVVRPKRHSLHPSDLQLIFNMLFEAEGVKAGGGENWIPLCLPGFNKNGYLYMYVSFLNAEEGKERPDTANSERSKDDVAMLLISANKESFFELQAMRDTVIQVRLWPIFKYKDSANTLQQLEKNGSIAIIRAAVRMGRPSTADIVPGTVLRHFLYKSRANVQFTMPSFGPHFNTALERRRLMSLYHTLHDTVHAKYAHLKVHHCMSRESIAIAWSTPTFELYCVAGPNSNRNALAQGANKVIQWVKREEERLFIIGGATF
jgi:vacuolar fusion protein MON1